MSSRSRILLYGCAGLFVFAGGVCAGVVHGLVGQLLTIVLISLGLGGAVLLLFLEVGLSEDRQRARDEEERRAGSNGGGGAPRAFREQRTWRPRRPS